MVEIRLQANNPEKAAAVLKESIELEKHRIIYGLKLTRNRLKRFKRKYKISSERFIHEWITEDLKGGDLEYIEWAGEYKVFLKLNDRLDTLKNNTHDCS